MTSQEPDIAPLARLMARLRDRERGCPWDVDQSFETIAPYTLEEAYEVADAIARGDMAALREELGDLLFQVVFHAQMAQEAGHFDLNDVMTAIVTKMERRHPHVFGDAQTPPDWETLKAAERSKKQEESALDGVALALPALLRAEKLQKRAARTGFDWPDASGPLGKVHEEIAEVQAAAPEEVEGEIGDLLFAVVNWARHLGVDPEAALRTANAKFERRFRAIETAPDFSALTLDEKEALWQAAKRKA